MRAIVRPEALYLKDLEMHKSFMKGKRRFYGRIVWHNVDLFILQRGLYTPLTSC